ncbi:hypothetical protein SECTIM467_61 [Brevibacillus phage SecTim467]|uniref:Uncharacterized protein n=2 Tax=Jenstvirus jenst TaxID=1982225 RepID=A0A0K2CP33_9CAUD|nr:hypothetical protein AVV11_gp130 [Brevibacillus phage Jenst]ALA07190.1 hypothetical protein JENST_61 [Brevibacillus phage Jenst]ALA07587.1 hypothetical protein SECTIM467_61 [Brevibacillus phage SecTim467]
MINKILFSSLKMARTAQDNIVRRIYMKTRIAPQVQNPDIDDRYVSVYIHRGIDICTLRGANPSTGDRLGYVIDHNHFWQRSYDNVQSAIDDIDANMYKWDDKR